LTGLVQFKALKQGVIGNEEQRANKNYNIREFIPPLRGLNTLNPLKVKITND